MAWTRLRIRRSSTPQVTSGNGNGAAPEGVGTHVAASDDAGKDGAAQGGTGPNGSAGAAASDAPPPGWPDANGAGAAGPADAPETAETAKKAADADDVRFWDWAPAQESAERDRGRSTRSSEFVVTPVEVTDDEPQREGIGQRLGNLAHLSANPRMRTWQRRAIIAIVVGVVFTIWVSWRLGLTLAVLAAIADTVYRSRVSYARPGEAQMTGAQRRTRRQLARLGRAGYRAMHLLTIPGSEDHIDHLVVGPAGVFSIDSEAWTRRTPVRTSSHRELWYGSVNQKQRLEQSRRESEQAAEVISRALGSPVSVHPAMAVYGPKIPWVVANIRDVDVFSGPQLRKYLRRQVRQARRRGDGPLSRSDVERIDKAAHIAFGQDPAADLQSR